MISLWPDETQASSACLNDAASSLFPSQIWAKTTVSILGVETSCAAEAALGVTHVKSTPSTTARPC